MLRARCALICILAIFCNLAVGAYIGVHNPTYFVDWRQQINPDARHFCQLGENIFFRGVYSRQAEEPYQPDAARPPVVPLAVGLSLWLGNISILYALHITLHCLLAVLVTLTVTRVAGTLAGVAAGFFVAVDFCLAAMNFTAMSEPIFTTLFFAAVFVLATVERSLSAERQVLIAGLLIGAANLARPSAGYYIFCAGLMLAVATWRLPWRRSTAALGRMGKDTLVKVKIIRGWCEILPVVNALWGKVCRVGMLLSLLGGAYTVVIMPWVVRNGITHGMWTVGIGVTELVYSGVAGMMTYRDGISRDEAWDRISEMYQLPHPTELNNPWIGKRKIKELVQAVDRRKWEVVLSDPRNLVISMLFGVPKAFLSHPSGAIAGAARQPWVPPRAANILRGNIKEAIKRLQENSWFTIGVFAWHYILRTVVFVFAIVGSYAGLAKRQMRWATALLLGTVVYNCVLICVTGYDAYYRHWVPSVPLAGALAGIGVASWSICGKRGEHGRAAQGVESAS